MTPNYAFERTGSLLMRARVRRVCHFAPATRLKARQPAAQRERYTAAYILVTIAFCLLSPLSRAGDEISVPEGFVLQHMDPTDGEIARPRDWFYISRGTPSGWVWTFSKEDPAKGPYKTGLAIQLLVGVEKTTGHSREDFVTTFMTDKRTSTKVVRECEKTDLGQFYRKCLEVTETIPEGGVPTEFHIIYSLMWGKDMDMVAISIFGAPPETWLSVRSIAESMSTFVLIGPGFGKVH
jgi:hypothetical protein